ncbi:hypothetical protein G7Y89_g14343 [Cudoniella acicularis]|uniref:Uncharacterized protein n=1 Tax=Cudoniella acicularis TaxID=354080 RepID=A0A8H4R3P2_9HELO|nr:hypothetical protein G7Y89_g14343 [Cudoniella acicularis]
MSYRNDSSDDLSDLVDIIQGTFSGSDISSNSDHPHLPGGITPRFLGPREFRDDASSESSSLLDPILEHFAQYTPPASSVSSHIQQTSRPRTLSSDETTETTETTESDETNSYNSESSPERADRALGTPATSHASQEAEIPPVVDQDHEDEAIPHRLLLVGLKFQDEDWAEPLFCDTNDFGHAELINESFLEILENEHINHQVEPNATPWIPDAQGLRWPTSDNSTLAPSPGLAYREYYSPTGEQTQRHKRHERRTQKKRKAFLASRKALSTSLGSSCDGAVTGTPECGQAYFLAQCLTVGRWRSRRPTDWHDSNVESLRASSHRSQICHTVDCATFSPETLGSMVLPAFALSHLSLDSLSTFTADLIAPGSLAYSSEYPIFLYLGFGPAVSLQVCTFTTKNKKDLQSYQKRQGEEKLHVQESLPIMLNIFPVESHAGDLDAWLDQIIDSESELQEYVELMQRRHKKHLSVDILRCLVAWYSISKNKLLQPAHSTFRAALKLLMTMTLLRLVPKLKNIPEALSTYLSPQPTPLNSPHLSPIAPKLLTRQIKASIHHLQHDLLNSLFCHITCSLELAAEVKVAIALLLACVLELARNAGREFARYASTINSKVEVKSQDVTQYEMNMQGRVFERVQASVLDTAGKMGQLEEILRNMGSIMKGKAKEDEDCQFVSAILHTVF